MRIKDITEENRPRERLKKIGPEALSDAELLAIFLRTGTKEENVIDMSNRLLSKHGMDKLSDLSLKELQEIKGIGFAKACQIVAIFELTKRHNLAKKNIRKVQSAEDVYNYLSPRLSNLKQEHFIILCLDSKSKIIKETELFIGTLNESIIHPREVFKEAIRESANSIILVHNHPSGDCHPSTQDEHITDILVEAGRLLGIPVKDHVIIGKDSWWSWIDTS
jgi:DNA repair protein RadC